jgi:eukaryotic-like serine/threonine-protein kinase
MATSEQEENDLLGESIPATELPTKAVDSKPGEASTTSPDLPIQDSSDSVELLPAGSVLGQYRILERLGSGGMGRVYKAVHPVMERVVALKIISPRLMKETSARARFHREVRHAARLIHPNIVVAYDAAEVEGQYFLVMEYIPGRDLAQLLMRYSRPPVALACESIRQAALGLQYAHEHGMVHRDIKPANLMVASARPQPDGAMIEGWPQPPLVKILDFGLSRLNAVDGLSLGSGETLTLEGCIVGTPEFMAPEQGRDSRLVDTRSDIYSLGCTLYMMLAGRPPFKAASSFEMAVMHLSQPPQPITHYNPALPPELAGVVHRMLAKQPEDRFQTPGAVANALRPWARLNAAAAVRAPLAPTVPVPSPLTLPPDSGTKSSLVPPASGSLSLPLTPAPVQPPLEEPAIPPSLRTMRFPVLLRTFVLFIIFAAMGIGCVIYLPDIGRHLQQLWHRVTLQTSKTTQPR